MNDPTVVDELQFEATMVTAEERDHGADFVLHGIYFGESDPEMGGQHWNFTRILGPEDDGVCTVKEIQAVTVYDGITNFELSRNSVQCEFDESTAKSTGVRRLKIAFRVDDSNGVCSRNKRDLFSWTGLVSRTWNRMPNQARREHMHTAKGKLRSFARKQS